MARFRRPQVEQEHHRKAFEIYFAQGGRRSHERVAKELGVAVATVKSWSRHFLWAKRLAEREASAARHVADQALQSTSDELARNKKIIQMALVKVAKAISADKVKVQVGDLDRLIRLQNFLDGGQAPVTLEAFSRMPHVEAVLLFDAWIDSLSDDAMRALIAALRARGNGTRGPESESVGMSFVQRHADAQTADDPAPEQPGSEPSPTAPTGTGLDEGAAP